MTYLTNTNFVITNISSSGVRGSGLNLSSLLRALENCMDAYIKSGDLWYYKGCSESAMHPVCLRSITGIVVAASLLVFVPVYTSLWPPPESMSFVSFQHMPSSTEAVPKDELDRILERAAMENKTLIISVLNKAYVEENGMLQLFLRSLQEGEDTKFLIRHLLLVAVDEIAINSCLLQGLHCFGLITKDVDFSREVIYMSDGFIKMMWRRTLFLKDVLRRGYNFIFTDMDVMWLRNPFTKLNHDGEDMQISCDKYNGHPLDNSNPINTGFYHVVSNNKTIKLFDEWYQARNSSAGMKEQDVLSYMKSNGIFEQLRLKVRFLDTLSFSGFCEDSRDFREVATVHANCCRSVKAKLTDLTAVLEVWKKNKSIRNSKWPEHKACHHSWREDIKV